MPYSVNADEVMAGGMFTAARLPEFPDDWQTETWSREIGVASRRLSKHPPYPLHINSLLSQLIINLRAGCLSKRHLSSVREGKEGGRGEEWRLVGWERLSFRCLSLLCLWNARNCTWLTDELCTTDHKTQLIAQKPWHWNMWGWQVHEAFELRLRCFFSHKERFH